VEFSFAEQFFLVVFEGALRVYEAFRDRPRAFWAAWLALSTTAALYLLRPGDTRTERLPKR
jgi:hypothetical protein